MNNPLTGVYTERIKKLKEQALYVLSQEPDTRDSDKLLTWRVWSIFYGIGPAVSLSDFLNLPSEDAVKRVRAQIQNDDKLHLPTTWEIARSRGWAEAEWRAALGYTQNLFGELVKK